jgi:hypothetical protein
MTSRKDLLAAFDELLQPARFKDSGPNGLQVEGRSEVHHIVSGVTASLALIDAAIAEGADAVTLVFDYDAPFADEPAGLFRVQVDGNLVEAECLDRCVQHNLVAVNGVALDGKLLGNVAGGNRTVELAHFASLTDDDDDLTVKLLGNAAGGCLGLLVTLFNCGALGAELFEIALCGAQCLAAWQEEVAGIAVLDADDIAELAEIWNAFEKNNVHGSVLFCNLEIRGEWCFRF